MKNKLTIKELAPYLPYGLKVLSNKTETLIGIESAKVRVCEFELYFPIENCKPILRPLSDLTKEIEHNGEKFVPLHKLIKEDKAFTPDFINAFGYEELKVSVYELLLEWHFDVFGLIDKNLAVPVTKP